MASIQSTKSLETNSKGTYFATQLVKEVTPNIRKAYYEAIGLNYEAIKKAEKHIKQDIAKSLRTISISSPESVKNELENALLKNIMASSKNQDINANLNITSELKKVSNKTVNKVIEKDGMNIPAIQKTLKDIAKELES